MDSKTNLEPCSVPAQADKIAAGVSDLIRAWADAATEVTSGSARIVAGTIEDLSNNQCGTGRSSDEGDTAKDQCVSFSESLSICSTGGTRISGKSVRSAESSCTILTEIFRPFTGNCSSPAGCTSSSSRNSDVAEKTDEAKNNGKAD